MDFFTCFDGFICWYFQDLKSELKRLEHITDELLTKKAELHSRLNDSTKEEAFNLQRLDELSNFGSINFHTFYN